MPTRPFSTFQNSIKSLLKYGSPLMKHQVTGGLLLLNEIDINRKTMILTERESYAHKYKKLKHKNKATSKQKKRSSQNLKIILNLNSINVYELFRVDVYSFNFPKNESLRFYFYP